MGKIIDSTKEILRSIDANGYKINETKELTSVMIETVRSELSEFEVAETAKFYNNRIGSWTDRQKLEHDHYEFLKAFIIHKIGEVRYFHKDQDLTSRKFVIWSNDCIASIQFLHRPEQKKNTLNVFIRSSDALNLLPADLLAGWEILNAIILRFNLEEYNDDEVNYFISSCHYYLKDQMKVRDIID